MKKGQINEMTKTYSYSAIKTSSLAPQPLSQKQCSGDRAIWSRGILQRTLFISSTPCSILSGKHQMGHVSGVNMPTKSRRSWSNAAILNATILESMCLRNLAVPGLKDLLTSMWLDEPEARPTAATVRQTLERFDFTDSRTLAELGCCNGGGKI